MFDEEILVSEQRAREILGMTQKLWQRKRAKKKGSLGPMFTLIDGEPYFRLDDLTAWAASVGYHPAQDVDSKKCLWDDDGNPYRYVGGRVRIFLRLDEFDSIDGDESETII